MIIKLHEVCIIVYWPTSVGRHPAHFGYDCTKRTLRNEWKPLELVRFSEHQSWSVWRHVTNPQSFQVDSSQELAPRREVKQSLVRATLESIPCPHSVYSRLFLMFPGSLNQICFALTHLSPFRKTHQRIFFTFVIFIRVISPVMNQTSSLFSNDIETPAWTFDQIPWCCAWVSGWHISDSHIIEHPEVGYTAVKGMTSLQPNHAANLALCKSFLDACSQQYKKMTKQYAASPGHRFYLGPWWQIWSALDTDRPSCGWHLPAP